MIHAKCHRWNRAVTARRLAAAARHLDGELAAVPLFAAEVAAEQETPEERIARIDAERAEWWQQMRDLRAKRWRRCRAILLAMPPEERRAALTAWARCPFPKTSDYCIDFLRRFAEH